MLFFFFVFQTEINMHQDYKMWMMINKVTCITRFFSSAVYACSFIGTLTFMCIHFSFILNSMKIVRVNMNPNKREDVKKPACENHWRWFVRGRRSDKSIMLKVLNQPTREIKTCGVFFTECIIRFCIVIKHRLKNKSPRWSFDIQFNSFFTTIFKHF